VVFNYGMLSTTGTGIKLLFIFSHHHHTFNSQRTALAVPLPPARAMHHSKGIFVYSDTIILPYLIGISVYYSIVYSKMLSKAASPLRLLRRTLPLGPRPGPAAAFRGASARHINPSALFAARFSSSGPTPTDSTSPSLDGSSSAAAEKVFSAFAGVEDATNSIVEASPALELGWNPVDIAIYAIENLHQYADIPYWQAIVVFTVALRFTLLPIALRGVQNANKMALLKPDMNKVQNAMKSSEGMADPKLQEKYQLEMKELFIKHDVNPFRALALPFMQMPIFISLFMGLRQVQDYYPDYCNGGVLWFTDLSVADPTYALPVLNALSFLLMIEVGAEGMDESQRGMFKNVMRGLAVIMIPLTASMPQGLFVYWAANNTLSMVQAVTLKTQMVKDALGIKVIPKMEGDAAAPNPFKSFAEVGNIMCTCTVAMSSVYPRIKRIDY
jgi:YidC/Oxa1 family membrane protein insertase